MKKKTIWIVYSNTDLTEGRGNQFPLYYCESEATANRLAKNSYVMGTRAPIRTFDSPYINQRYLAPYDLIRSTDEDIKRQQDIDIENKLNNDKLELNKLNWKY